MATTEPKSDAADLVEATRELREVVGQLTVALRSRKSTRAISECEGAECGDKKTKRKARCIFGSPLTCCCWMMVCMIGLFFVFAFVSAIFGDHSSSGTCPNIATPTPQYNQFPRG